MYSIYFFFHLSNLDARIGINRIYASTSASWNPAQSGDLWMYSWSNFRRTKIARSESRGRTADTNDKSANDEPANEDETSIYIYRRGFNIPPLKAVVDAVRASTRDYQRLILFAKCAGCIRHRNPIKTNLVKICMRPDDLLQSIKPQFFWTIRFFFMPFANPRDLNRRSVCEIHKKEFVNNNACLHAY